MKIVSLLAPLLLLASSSALLAQEASPAAKEAPPDPPLMGKAPAECQWTITYTPRKPEKDAATSPETHTLTLRQYYSPLVLSKRILKSAGQLMIYTEYEAGLKSEAWVIGGIVYELPYRKGQTLMFEERKTSDFSEIDWVKADNFRGTVELKGAKVHLYESGDANAAPASPKSPATPPPPSTLPAKKQIRRVYIDAITRLPVVVDLGEKVLTYQYAGPVATFPTPNDTIKKLLDDAAGQKKR